MNDKNENNHSKPVDTTVKRKPYVPPCIEVSAKFETLALACATLPNTYCEGYGGGSSS